MPGQAERPGRGHVTGGVVDEQRGARLGGQPAGHDVPPAGSLTRPVSTWSSLPPNSAPRNAAGGMPSRLPQ